MKPWWTVILALSLLGGCVVTKTGEVISHREASLKAGGCG